MIKKFIPLLPLVAVCLFACGAAEQEPPAAMGDAPENTAVVQSSEAVLRPVGTMDVSALPRPETMPADWREIAADQWIYLRTIHGVSLIELAPDFAPGHTARFAQFARDGYYKGMPFHRVIEGFMAQAGDWIMVSRPAPKTENLKAEFKFRRAPTMKMHKIGEHRSADAGFINGFPVASQNAALAMMTADGKVDAWQLHCPGAAAAARLGNDINSANAQFYITTAYPRNLDKNYTIWGRVRAGLPAVYQIKKGEPVMPPDMIEEFRLGADMDAAKRPRLWVMNTNSPAFSKYLETLKDVDGNLPSICNIDVPAIVRWPSAQGET